jgi:hypothetical protein
MDIEEIKEEVKRDQFAILRAKRLTSDERNTLKRLVHDKQKVIMLRDTRIFQAMGLRL